ncbi:MAG TPA: hypothetical protein VMP11_03940 [Verrucomicrobiae bacterium]|nr:hypothetical protein [Verrucomicrobiae bacterium]
MSHPLLICLALALVVRLAFVFVVFPAIAPRMHLREDGDAYGQIAEAVREGEYVDVTRGPVYPVFLAVCGAPMVAKVVQALLDTMTVWLVFVLAGRRWEAAALWAVYPFAIWRVAFIGKETMTAFLLAGYVCVQVAAFRGRRAWLWLAAGGLLAVVNLCKPTFLAWPVLVLALAYLHRVPLSRVAMLVAGMVMLVAPWTYRNYVVTHGAFVPVATERGGVTTFIGNYQPTLGLWEGPGKSEWMLAVQEIESGHPGASVVELDRIFYRAAWEEMARDPLKAVEICARKCVRFWFESAARRIGIGAVLVQAVFLGLLGIGLRRGWPWDVDSVLALTLIAYVMLVHALSYADLRFSLAVMPLVCALAASAFHARARRTE